MPPPPAITASTTADSAEYPIDRDLPPLPETYISFMRGRPAKITREMISRIYDLILDGTPTEVACSICDITYDTFCRYRKEGEKLGPGSIYYEFLVAIKKARELREANLAKKWAKLVTEPTRKHKIVYKEIPVTDGDGNHVLGEDGELKVLRFKESETVEYTGDGDWRGVAEFLARRYKGRWAKSEGIELTGANGGPVDLRDATVPLEMLPVELRRQILMALEGLQQQQPQITEGNNRGVIDITPPRYRVAGLPCEGNSERVCDGWVEMEDREEGEDVGSRWDCFT